MNGRTLEPGHYRLSELRIGDVIETASLEVTVAMIDDFAALTKDRFEIHMCTEAAQKHGFADRVAHGLLVLSLVDGLKNQAPAQFSAIASLGWAWDFSAPVLAGDQIAARISVRELRKTSDGKRGIVTLDFNVRNQRNETVQHGINRLMVYA